MTGRPARSLNERFWSGVTRNVKPGALVPAGRILGMLSPPSSQFWTHLDLSGPGRDRLQERQRYEAARAVALTGIKVTALFIGETTSVEIFGGNRRLLACLRA